MCPKDGSSGEWVQSWDDELMKMNANKVGSPYQFPNSMIQMQGIWHVKEIPYRMIEGITRRLYLIANLPDFNHYSTVNRSCVILLLDFTY
jgi:hypothetical protein